MDIMILAAVSNDMMNHRPKNGKWYLSVTRQILRDKLTEFLEWRKTL